MKSYWCSMWVKHRDISMFEYHGPWWVSGYTDDSGSVCAAVMAEDEDAAKRVLANSFDDKRSPETLEWRFVNEMGDKSPFSDRFQRDNWMKWPWPEGPTP